MADRQKALNVRKAVDAGEEYNTQELGYKDREDFEANASSADRQALEGMWH